MRVRKKVNSIVWQAIFFPAGITILMLMLAIFLCVFSVRALNAREIESNINAIQISINQLESELNQIDDAFVEYWYGSDAYKLMSKLTQQRPIGVFLEGQWETFNWLDKQVSMYSIVEGAFAYYSNLNLLLFRGGTNAYVHQYIASQMDVERNYNRWELVWIDEAWYLVTIKNYNDFYGGVWIPVQKIFEHLKIDDHNLLGTVYLMDWKCENTAEDGFYEALLDCDVQQSISSVRISNVKYDNFIVKTQEEDVYLGILIPKGLFLAQMPTAVWGIFVLVIISAILVPLLIIWLKRKIATPIRVLDDAMKVVGDGNMDYRIPAAPSKYPNEMERLTDGFNDMIDEINDLEMRVYKGKIREQQIKLKYISQMIQPHFVLNALNVIYTYKESEFPLVKKMIRYLMEYFRYIVYMKTDFVTLEQEMRHIENYLKIQKERYLDGFEFFVEWEAEVSNCVIPPLVIQSFAENCLKYGKRDDESFFVYVLANVVDGRLRLMIADSGNGFAKEKLDKIHAFVETREYCDDLGIGIQNAIERMDILYDQWVEVNVHNADYGGAIVELFLPLV